MQFFSWCFHWRFSGWTTSVSAGNATPETVTEMLDVVQGYLWSTRARVEAEQRGCNFQGSFWMIPKDWNYHYLLWFPYGFLYLDITIKSSYLKIIEVSISCNFQCNFHTALPFLGSPPRHTALTGTDCSFIDQCASEAVLSCALWCSFIMFHLQIFIEDALEGAVDHSLEFEFQICSETLLTFCNGK